MKCDKFECYGDEIERKNDELRRTTECFGADLMRVEYMHFSVSRMVHKTPEDADTPINSSFEAVQRASSVGAEASGGRLPQPFNLQQSTDEYLSASTSTVNNFDIAL